MSDEAKKRVHDLMNDFLGQMGGGMPSNPFEALANPPPVACKVCGAKNRVKPGTQLAFAKCGRCKTRLG